MNRFTQGSTYAGIGIALQVLKGFFPAWAGVIDGFSAAAAGAAVHFQ